MAAFHFFQLHRRKRSLHAGPSEKGPILNAGPFEKFLVVYHPKEDHNEREFKP